MIDPEDGDGGGTAFRGQETNRPEPSREWLLAALHVSKIGTWRWAVSGGRLVWDDELCAMYGIERDRAPASIEAYVELVHPDDRQSLRNRLQAATRSGAASELEFRVIRPDGSVRWIHDSSGVMRQGRRRWIVGASRDITERKHAEQALAERADRLEMAAAAAGLGIWDWDLLSDTIILSPRAKEIFGLAEDAAVTAETLREAVYPDDRPRTAAVTARALDPAIREQRDYEYRMIRGDGALRWVAAHGHAVFRIVDGVRRAVRYVGTMKDITARQRIERALQASESRLRLALDAGRMAVWEYDPRTDRITGSRELNRLLGYPEDSAPSIADVREGFAEGELERVRSAGREAMARGERFFQAEFRFVRRDTRDPRWLLLRAELQIERSGTPERIIGVLFDVTEQKSAAVRQKLLTRELDHRVKNMFAVVMSLVSQTLRHTPDPAAARRDIEGRLISLSGAHDLLNEAGWESANLASAVDRALAPFLQQRRRISTGGPDMGISAQVALNLAMILHELATNALKYGALSRERGRVSLHWWQDDCDHRPCVRMCWRETGGPKVTAPDRSGFGMRLIRGLASEMLGDAALEFEENGLVCTITFLAEGDGQPPAT